MDGDDEESLESVMLAEFEAWVTEDCDEDGVEFEEAMFLDDDGADVEVDIMADKSVPE